MDARIRRSIDRYAEDIHLRFEDQRRLNGYASISDKNGDGSFDYFLRFDFQTWPRLFPLVYDVGHGMKPYTANNHMFPNGKLCLEVDVRQRYLIKIGEISSLYDFHEYILLPYLAKQFDFQNGNRKAFHGAEWAHGARGLLDAYASIANVSRDASFAIVSFYRNHRKHTLVPEELPKGHCSCGSGLTYKLCLSIHRKLCKMAGLEQLNKDASYLYSMATNST